MLTGPCRAAAALARAGLSGPPGGLPHPRRLQSPDSSETAVTRGPGLPGSQGEGAPGRFPEGLCLRQLRAGTERGAWPTNTGRGHPWKDPSPASRAEFGQLCRRRQGQHRIPPVPRALGLRAPAGQRGHGPFSFLLMPSCAAPEGRTPSRTPAFLRSSPLPAPPLASASPSARTASLPRLPVRLLRGLPAKWRERLPRSPPRPRFPRRRRPHVQGRRGTGLSGRGAGGAGGLLLVPLASRLLGGPRLLGACPSA